MSTSEDAVMTLDFSRCRKVWVPPNHATGAEGYWNPPFEHVKVGVEEIVAHPYFMLADDMGLSKTAQAIIAAQFLHDMGVIDRVIVVAPASVRPKVWFDQDLGQLAEQVWDDKRNFVTEYHSRRKRWTHGPADARELRWIVTNYDYIRSRKNLAELLPYCGPKTLLILDESMYVRTWDSKQTEACKMLRWLSNRKGRPVLGAPRCGRILLMTGTPVAESNRDLFSQGNLMHPSILECPYITHFEARYAVKAPIFGAGGRPMLSPYGKPLMDVVGWTNTEDLQRRFAPYVLRREAKALGIDFALPPVGLEVTLTDTTWRHYRQMRDELVVWLESGVATSSTAATKAIRLAQITSGFLGGVEDANIGDDNDRDNDRDRERATDTEQYFDFDKYCIEGVTREERQNESLDGPTKFETCEDVGGRAEKITESYRETKQPIVVIGREKLDYALSWQAEMLKADPNLKLLSWCRFVFELRRYLAEIVAKFPHVSVGAACGEKVLDMVPGSQKAEREYALRLLHPKTAPEGPVTVGATQGTGAIGLNFTACRTVLDISYDYSPWKKKQGDARVNRQGQTGPVSFYYLVAVGPKGQKTIDHHVMLTRLGKADMNDWTVKAWVKALREE